jgi:hypothetical protein
MSRLLIFFLLVVTLTELRPSLSNATKQDQTFDDLSALSDCSVSIYEAIRFVAVKSQNTINLKSLASDYERLLEKFERHLTTFANLPESNRGKNTRRLSTLRQIGSVLQSIARALRAGDPEDLFQQLTAAKFLVNELNELVNVADFSPPSVEESDIRISRRRLSELQEVADNESRNANQAREDLRRLDDLVRSGVASRAERDAASHRLNAADAAMRLAQARLETQRDIVQRLTGTNRSEPRFNRLTHLTTDPNGQVKFFGQYDPQGPQSIPYAELLAAALRVDEEKLDPQTQVRSPVFTFVPAAGFHETQAEFRAKARNRDELLEATSQFYETDIAARERYLKSSRQQALPEIRYALKRMLSTRMKRELIDERIDPITTDELLAQALNRLFREGILKDKDGDELLFFLNTAIGVYQSSPSNLFFYPQGTAEGVIRKCLFVEPRFYGFESRTDFARILFHSDVALKELIGDYTLTERLPFHQTYIEWRFRNTPPAELLLSVPATAIQLWPKSLTLSASADRRLLVFDKADVEIKIRPAFSDEPPAKLDLDYANYLTKHFAEYAAEIDSLWEYRELLKILGAVRYLRKQGVSLAGPAPQDVWEPPHLVQAKWQVASVGTGDNYIVSTGFFGGVELQIQNQTRVLSLAEDRARALLSEYGRASGRPIGDDQTLATMDRPDAITNLRVMPLEDLEQLGDRLSNRGKRLEESVAAIKRQELPLQLKASSPPPYRTIKDATIEMMEKLPGAGLAERLGQAAAGDLGGAPKVDDMWARFQREEPKYQKDLDDLLDSREVFRLAINGLEQTRLEINLTMTREVLQAYRAFAKGSTKREGLTKAAPHLGKIFEQLPETMAANLEAAKNSPAFQASVGVKAKVLVMATKLAAEMTFVAANTAWINRILRAERETNRLLLLNVHGTRTELERKQRENGTLLQLVRAEQQARATQSR